MRIPQSGLALHNTSSYKEALNVFQSSERVQCRGPTLDGRSAAAYTFRALHRDASRSTRSMSFRETELAPAARASVVMATSKRKKSKSAGAGAPKKGFGGDGGTLAGCVLIKVMWHL